MISESQPKILIVNDLEDQLELMKAILNLRDYGVHATTSPAEAFRIARSIRPDLVISDVSMPDIDGIELCRMIRMDKDLQTIPVLLVSALRKDSESVIQGLRTGAYDYIEAPYDPDQFLAKVERLVEINSTLKNLRENEEKYQALLEQAPDGILIFDRQGTFIEVNARACEIFGYTCDELVNRNFEEFIPPQDIAQPIHFEELLSGIPVLVERYARRKDGRLVPLTISATQLEDGRLQAIVHDISGRKRTEEALVEREKLLQAIIDTEPECVKVIDKDGIVLVMNPAGLEMIEADLLDQVIGQSIYPFVAPDYLEKFKGLIERVGRGEAGRLEFEIVGLKGMHRWMEMHAAPLRDHGNKIFASVAVSRDISEQRQAERALRKNLSILTGIIEGTTDAVFVKDTDSRYQMINSAGARLFGKAAHEIVGRDDSYVFPPATAQRIMRIDREMVASGEPETYEGDIETVAGIRTYLTTKAPYRNEDGDIIGLIGIARDITPRKQIEKELRESEARYRLLFENNPLPMWVVDLETLSFLAVNEAAIRHYGYSRDEFLAMTRSDIRQANGGSPLADKESLDGAGVETPRVWRHLKKDGTIIDVEVRVHEIDFDGRRAQLVLLNDITERKLAEKKLKEKDDHLRQVQRLEAIGQLAGGVAHDFNNLLTVIGGYNDLMLQNLPADNPMRQHAEEVKKAAERAASLTHQLLAFSRKQVLQPKVLELNSLVSNMGSMLRRLIGENIELVISLRPDAGTINADQGQIEQVVMNLVLNARDAMPQGGKLVIETKNVVLDQSFSERRSMVKPGPYVMLAVSDNGGGMDEATQKRIFEPFFTTKGVGKGTGLGLATVYGIVKQSGGNIWVYSVLGKGTTFKVYLPLVEQEAGPQEKVRQPSVSRGTETILLVEDEAMVRDLAKT